MNSYPLFSGVELEQILWNFFPSLPAVYDESFSYLEFLGNVLKNMNEERKHVNDMTEAISIFQKYVLEELKNYDTKIETKVTEQINNLILDGTIADIINKTLFAEIRKEIDTKWEIIPIAEITEPLDKKMYIVGGKDGEDFKGVININGVKYYVTSTTDIIKHESGTLKEKLESLDLNNSQVSTKIGELENSISTNLENAKQYTDDTKETITTEYTKSVNDSATKLTKDINYKSKLAKNLQYFQRNFIDYTKNDSNLHLQGMCKLSDNELLISYGSLSESVTNGVIILYDLLTDTIKNTFKNVPIFHSNDLSYRKETNEIYVASMYDTHHTNVTVIDYATMTKKRVIDLSVLSETHEDVWVIGIDCHDDYYWVSTAEECVKFDYSNNILKRFPILNPDNVFQSMVEVNNNLYLLEMWNLFVYDEDGNLLRNYNLPRSGEVEGIVHLKDLQFIISHSNNAFLENNDTLKNVDLSEDNNAYFWTIYDNIDMLGIKMGSSEETIENICKSLGNRTQLYWTKIADNVATGYPADSGLLEVKKYDETKVTLKFTQASSNQGNVWVGNYNPNLSPSFSGWKKLSTEDYRNIEFASLGFTLDDFTTDFNSNVEKILGKLGKNRIFVCYPWSGQSNLNFYNSVKTWCGVTSDGYTVKIESSINGTTGITNKITVIPNASSGDSVVEIYSYYDNSIGSPKTMVSLETVKSLIATSKSEILATCDTRYQPKTSV